jgi:hypothetical protein
MTYTYGEKKVIIENGLVTHSDTSLCTVGQKPNIKALRACGWQLVKTIKPSYINGENGNRFSN